MHFFAVMVASVAHQAEEKNELHKIFRMFTVRFRHKYQHIRKGRIKGQRALDVVSQRSLK